MSALVLPRRASILVACADHLAKKRGVDPETNAASLAAAWRKASPASHRELFVLAGMRPDPIVMGQVLDILDARAERVGAATCK